MVNIKVYLSIYYNSLYSVPQFTSFTSVILEYVCSGMSCGFTFVFQRCVLPH